MKKPLLILLALVAAAFAVVALVASSRPAAFHVERSVRVAAPAAAAYALLSDFGRFPEWSPWEKYDPKAKKQISEPSTGVGATYAWQSEEIGSGRMTIVGLTPGERVDVKLEFLQPFPSTSSVAFLTQQGEGETRVTWTMDGNSEGLVPKIFALFVSMDSMVGKDFEDGLQRLKGVVEGR